MQLSVHFQSKWHDAPFCAFLSIFTKVPLSAMNGVPSKYVVDISTRRQKDAPSHSASKKMRRLILHPGDKLPGLPNPPVKKFTRGPICALMRPRPFIYFRHTTKKRCWWLILFYYSKLFLPL